MIMWSLLQAMIKHVLLAVAQRSSQHLYGIRKGSDWKEKTKMMMMNNGHPKKAIAGSIKGFRPQYMEMLNMLNAPHG